jgi:hypothetical protein
VPDDPVTARTRKIITEAYEAAAGGDGGKLLDCLHPDAEIFEAPLLPFGGVYRGVKGLEELLTNITPWMNMSGIQMVKIMADGEWGCGIMKTPTQDGQLIDIVEMWELRDGKLWRAKVYYFDISPLIKGEDLRDSGTAHALGASGSK